MEFTISKIQKNILFISIAFIIFNDLYYLYYIKIPNNTFINYTMDLIVTISKTFISIFFIIWFKNIQQRFLLGLTYFALVVNIIISIMELLSKIYQTHEIINLILFVINFYKLHFIFGLIWSIKVLSIHNINNKAIQYLKNIATSYIVGVIFLLILIYVFFVLHSEIDKNERNFDYFTLFLIITPKTAIYLFFILCVKEIKTQPIINLD